MTAATVAASVLRIPVDQIRSNPRNPRRVVGDLSDLISSIFAHGILNPLLVTPVESGWLLLAGHRRLAAAKESGMIAVPCIQVRSQDAAGQAAVMLAENVARSALDPIDEAKAYKQLRRGGLTDGDIAAATGVRVERVRQRLKLLTLPAEAQRMVSRGELTQQEGLTLVREVKRKNRGEVDQSRCPSTFTKAHALASDAQAYCDGLAHPRRGRIGAVACGQCWENVIRHDERTSVAGVA